MSKFKILNTKNKNITYFIVVIVCILHFLSATSQTITIQGTVADTNQKAIVGAIITIQKNHTITDSVGKFQFHHLLAGKTLLLVTHTSFKFITKLIAITTANILPIPIILEHNENMLDEVVVTGVTKSMLLKESPISITNC